MKIVVMFAIGQLAEIPDEAKEDHRFEEDAALEFQDWMRTLPEFDYPLSLVRIKNALNTTEAK